jgi:D-galactonate transporter
MPPAAPTDEDRLYDRIFWKIVPFLMLCYVIAYLDRVNVGFAKLEMAGDLNFSETVYGLGAGIFFIGYFLFEVPSNLILQRVGARLWLTRIMVTWGLISALFAFVRTPAIFYLLRFLLGVAEAGFFPGVILYLTYWFPSHRRARIVAIFMTGIPLSGVLGNPLSGWIMDRFHDVGGLRGWQWLFVIEAVPAVIVGIVLYHYLGDGPGTAVWLSAEEKQLIERNRDGQRPGDAAVHSVAAVFSDRRVWHMCLIYFSFVMGLYGLTFWMPTLVAAAGVVGGLRTGLISAIPYLFAVIVMVLLGQSADRWRERRWHLVVPALVGCVGFVVAALAAKNVAVAITFLSVAAGGVMSCVPLFWSLPTSFLRGAGAAAGIAVINSVGNLAGFVSPYMIGALKDFTHDNRIGMFVLAGMLVVGALAVWRTDPQLVNR